MSNPSEQLLPFFVYGTLRPGESNYLKLLAGIDLEHEPATLDGVVLHNGPGYPYMYRHSSGIVTGDLLYLDRRPQRYAAELQRLDELEGYDPLAHGQPTNHYDRHLVTVTDSDGTEIQAWAYFAGVANRQENYERIESGDWLNR